MTHNFKPINFISGTGPDGDTTHFVFWNGQWKGTWCSYLFPGAFCFTNINDRFLIAFENDVRDVDKRTYRFSSRMVPKKGWGAICVMDDDLMFATQALLDRNLI